MPRPIPRLAPVINAHLPLSFIVLVLHRRWRRRESEDVVALRVRAALENRDVALGNRFVARGAEDDEFAAAGFEYSGHPFRVRVQPALPQDLAGVLFEGANRAVGVRA